MRIVDKRKKQTHFADVKIGETFIADELFCVRMNPFTDDKQNQYNAFDLVNNDLAYFYNSDMVVKVESTITVS